MERRMARQEKQTLLDTLVGGIAHELNNKLTPVYGFSELISLQSENETRHYSALITKSVDEAAKIIRQLLQLSRPVARSTQLVELRSVVDEALSMMRFQIRESRCVVRSTAATVPTWVEVDPAEIKQVVMNLVLNAIQAMADRTDPVLDVEVRAEATRAVICVRDNGVGIPPENLERIFDPFFTTKGPERGTGLGLSVCYSIVRQHGGEISVASEAGRGACFTVSLPREVATGGVSLTPSGVQPVAASPSETVDGVRVLVVEDEPHVRRLIRDVLTSKFGCDVDTAANGIEALERAAACRYALILSDVRMAGMNGTELYLWLREAQPETARRFVFISGYPGESHLQAETAEWGVPMVTKPFSVAQLVAACAPYLTDAIPFRALTA
jgi:two-component system NtrC family sensor kinase